MKNRLSSSQPLKRKTAQTFYLASLPAVLSILRLFSTRPSWNSLCALERNVGPSNHVPHFEASPRLLSSFVDANSIVAFRNTSQMAAKDRIWKVALGSKLGPNETKSSWPYSKHTMQLQGPHSSLIRPDAILGGKLVK
jgi:hypothetical protein